MSKFSKLSGPQNLCVIRVSPQGAKGRKNLIYLEKNVPTGEECTSQQLRPGNRISN